MSRVGEASEGRTDAQKAHQVHRMRVIHSIRACTTMETNSWAHILNRLHRYTSVFSICLCMHT